MGVLTFRVPQEGLDQFKNAIDIISLIREIANNPKISDTVKDLSQKLSDAQQLSFEKQKAAFDAEEIITQSKEAVEELEQLSKTHQDRVISDNSQIESNRKLLKVELAKFADEKATVQKLADSTKLDAATTLAKAKELLESAKTVQAKADVDNQVLIVKQNDYDSKVQEFEKLKNSAEIELSQKIAAYEADVNKLIEDRAAFDLRRKKFEDAMKE